MEYIYEQTYKESQAGCSRAEFLQERDGNGPANDMHQTLTLPYSGKKWNDSNAPWRAGEFFQRLSLNAMSDFESLAVPFWSDGTMTLFTEDQQPRSILFLLEGRVKLSVNSSEGRRLILGIAGSGDVLGLTSAVLGGLYEMTAEPQFPCTIASLERQKFLDFLVRYPIACQNVARQLSLEYKKACEQMRTLGITSSAPAKLARLLVNWCAGGLHTEHGIRIQCSLTHEEIGEYIGVSRETISRTLADFKTRELAEQRGSTLVVLNLRALEIYAGAG
jgi:CRP/FNR family cyclic AMP-dependent transcriptional regulator